MSKTKTNKKYELDAEHKDYVARLRCALMDDTRKDRDVTATIKPFMVYKKNDLDLTIHFTTKLSSSLSKFALQTCKANMQEIYDKSGYMWDDDDKLEELTQHGGAARFLIIREAHEEEGKGKPVGFVHFRFTLQGEAVGVLGGEPALYIMDIQLVDAVKRKGLGRHLIRTLEMIARQQKMMHVMLPVTVADTTAKDFFLNGMKGFVQDDLSKVVSRDGSDACQLLAEDGTFVVISKALEPVKAAAPVPAATTPQKAPPTDAQLSAANTPNKSENPQDAVQAAIDFVQQQEYKAKLGKLGDNIASMKSGAALPAFDPTFGGAAANKPADAGGEVASQLMKELVAFGAVPAGLTGQAQSMLMDLMNLFKMKNGRDPTEAEVAKWVKVVRDAVDEGGFVVEEEEDEDNEDDDEDDDEEEDEEDDDDEVEETK